MKNKLNIMLYTCMLFKWQYKVSVVANCFKVTNHIFKEAFTWEKGTEDLVCVAWQRTAFNRRTETSTHGTSTQTELKIKKPLNWLREWDLIQWAATLKTVQREMYQCTSVYTAFCDPSYLKFIFSPIRKTFTLSTFKTRFRASQPHLLLFCWS